VQGLARVRPGETLHIATAPFVHLFVARGSAELEGAGPLTQGDAVRATRTEGRRVTGGPEGAEILMWEMTAALSVG
jgi:redox-sensitive bicupin YhaK (pirin superfamily)